MMKINEQYGIGEGWIPLVEDAIRLVNTYNINHPNENSKLEFRQIKEKWGGLRLYLNYYTPEIDNKIRELEDISYTICECCGTNKNVSTNRTNGYIYTLCDNCRKEMETKK